MKYITCNGLLQDFRFEMNTAKIRIDYKQHEVHQKLREKQNSINLMTILTILKRTKVMAKSHGICLDCVI